MLVDLESEDGRRAARGYLQPLNVERTEREHIAMFAVSRRGTGAVIPLAPQFVSESDRAGRQQRGIRISRVLGERGELRRQVVDGPVPPPTAGGGVRVKHRQCETPGSGWRALPVQGG